jgi:hypothetical protein
MGVEGFALSAGTVTAISAIVSTITAAFVRVLTVKGKYRAQAADVLVDAALTQRNRAEDCEAENVDLRAALAAVINAVDYSLTNGKVSEGSLLRLHKVVDTARVYLERKEP